ncbi:MAG: hypothetical protein IJ109_10525 [Firmicutes bacterium]|nr:hypothetical protein [Bacillota bacterium]MBQ9016531.1 hypothetical protein [Bacillota bacterium]
MNRHRTMTAFYLETVLMVIIFVLVIAILSQVFGLARSESRQAQQLTNAVCLAQNAAQAAAGADSEEGMLRLLDENGNARIEDRDGSSVVTAWYDGDMHPVSAEAAAADESALRLEATWAPKQSQTGSFVNSDIAVYAGASKDPVYTLNTGVYLREEGAR